METVKKQIITKEVTIRNYKCDICGKDTIELSDSKDGNVEIKVRDEEESYNDGSYGGYVKEYIYDVCRECIEQKIFPYIKELTGKEPREYEYNW